MPKPLPTAVCGQNLVPVKLELGGKGAAVVFDDVNRSGLGGGVLSVETLFDYWRNLSVVRPL
jgi:hypothetical protein